MTGPKPALVLQHHPVEEAGLIAGVLSSRGIPIETARIFDEMPVPRDPEKYSAVIAMGGPMSAYDGGKHPFIADELAFLEKAMKKEIPVLGICLGSQLMAAALGARVYPGPVKEIGFLPVTLTAEGKADAVTSVLGDTFEPLLWHGDIFDLPRGAVRLASSGTAENQAFRFGKSAYGLLFHMEAGRRQVRDMARVFAKELADEKIDAGLLAREADSRLEKLQETGAVMFGKWADILQVK